MARSKRKSSDEASSRGLKRRKEDDGNLHDASVFGELIKKAGFILKTENRSNELNNDQAMFQRDLELAIKRHPNFPDVLNEFTDALSNHLEDPTRLLRALMPTVTASSCESSARSGNQDSLLRLLLGIDQLQPSIMNMLLEKLAEFTDGDEPVMNENEEVNMPRLILSQFRWLNNIVNSKEVTEKMLEIICVVSLNTQREIIMCIPEVVDDAEHNNVAVELKTLLTENSQLTVPILDVLSNLTLKEDLLAEVRRSVISTLDSVSVEDLPVIVRFLLQTVAPAEAVEVITEFRQHMDFQSNFPSTATRNSKSKNKKEFEKANVERSSEALVLDSIRSGIRFQRCIADGWVKAIEQVKTATDHRTIDVFVVLVLHSCGHKKTVEGLVRGKVRSSHFTQLLLQDAFGDHTEVLREYFSAVLALCEVLLRSPEHVISLFAAAMYKHAFLSFDAYCQQEIVGSLVTHIGSGFLGEVDIALNIMSDLVQSHTEKIAPFGIFVKGVLDYLENLSMGQIRKLYGMLSILAYRSTQGESQIRDELYIIIRKQLSNTDMRYKKMGVIGAIMVIQTICTSPEYNNAASSVSLSGEALGHVESLLTLVRAGTKNSPQTNALFMDELCSVVSNHELDPKVESLITDDARNDFEQQFIVDLEPETLEQESILPMKPMHCIDSEAVAVVGINLLPIITQAIKDEGDSDEPLVSPMCLSPKFRLLQKCESRRNSNNLGQIDALLGCPIYTSEPEYADKMDSLSKIEKYAMCDCLLYTINWFREVVNGFASQIDPELKAKVIMRLQTITELQNLLPKYLSASSGYCPMVASFDGEEEKLTSAALGSSESTKKGRPKKGKKKGKDANKTSADIDTTVQESQQVSQADASTQAAEKPADGRTGVRWAAYRPYLRELDMDVFQILQAGLLTHTSLDTELNVKDTTSIQLQPPQLEFLLDDLVQKLEHILVASASTRRSFFKSKSRQKCGFSHLEQLGDLAVMKQALKLMPSLCDHLEATSAFFQAQVAANDGLIDGPGSSTPQALQIASCFQLLLVVIKSLCSWAGFSVPENQKLLTEMLSTMSLRLNRSAPQNSVPDLVKEAFHYVQAFSSSIPNLSTAVTLIRTLVSLMDRGDKEELREKIAKLAVSFLQREWRSPDGQPLKGAQHNELLQELLRTYLTNSADTVSALEELSTTGFSELLEGGNISSSDTYPTLTRHSFPAFYRVMLSQLVECSRNIPAYTENDTDNSKLDKLMQWGLAVRIFHIHVAVIKTHDSRALLLAILKHGRQFVDIFLRLAMPLLDHTFRHHRAEVQDLLKSFQQSTRTLHHTAGHSKIIRDVTLTNLVPPMKKSLEVFVYRVKGMLTLNNCLEAFWQGNLKNRDLRGEEILTQRSNETRGSDNESDRMPEEEEDDTTEETTVRGEDSESGESYSECF